MPSQPRLLYLLVGALLGSLLTLTLTTQRTLVTVAADGTTSTSSSGSSSSSSSGFSSSSSASNLPPAWGRLRPNACDGTTSPDSIKTWISGPASIGDFLGRPVQLLRTLSERKGLAFLANDLNLTGKAVELGVWRGEFAEHNLNKWRGSMYVLVDLWTSRDTDCVNGNTSLCVYGGNESRSYDKMITELRMKRGGSRFQGRFQMVQNSTLEAARLFPDGHFDWLYLDATHTYAEAKADLEAWYPKVKPGGLVSGHDYQFQHQKIGDGYTFGVRDAVDEFVSRRALRVYQTSEPYLPSFYFLKCTRT